MRRTWKGSCIIREKSSKANDKMLPSFFYYTVKSKQERIAVCGLTFPFATAT